MIRAKLYGLVFLMFCSGSMYATITFTNASVDMIINDQKLKVDVNTSFKGFDQRYFSNLRSDILSPGLDKNGIFENSGPLPLKVCGLGDDGTPLSLAYPEAACFIRTLSNAFVYCCRTNSESLLYSDRVNSQVLGYHNDAIGLLGVSALQAAIDITENTKSIRLNSNAFLYCCRTSSNALLLSDRMNSQALLYDDRVSSNAFLYCDRTNSNAFLYGDRVNSSAFLYDDRVNSNACVYSDRINSQSLFYSDRINSQSLYYSDRINSQSLLYNERVMSNAFLYCCRINSNAFLYDDRVNSNALVYSDRANSQSLFYSDRINSQSLVYSDRINSQSLVYSDRITSNVLAYGNVQLRLVSNAMVYCCRITSEALLYSDRMNSQALMYSDRINSEALMYGDRMNSQALLYGDRVNSEALLYGDRMNSEALMYGDRMNSQALLYGDRVNSEALLYGDRMNSEALMYGDRMNSQALVYSDRVNSLAIFYSDRINSQALLYSDRVNSNAIEAIAEETDTIVGLLTICGNFNQVFDLWPSNDDPIHITCDSVVFGNGHFWQFARHNENFITVDNGVTVEFRDVVFKDFSDKAFNLIGSARVIFGDGTVIELSDSEQLSRDWMFAGDVRINGFGNQLDLATSQLTAGWGSYLSLFNVSLLGVKQTNVNVDYNGLLKLRDTKMCLSQDYSFTSGRFSVDKDVVITGTSEFKYTTTSTSMIKSCGTLKLIKGTTFSYQPALDNRDLIAMEDVSSILLQQGCSLQSSTTGMRLTSGTLYVEYHNPLFNPGAVSLSEGFALGNGIITQDLNVVLLPGGSLDLRSGLLSYDNVA